MMEPAGRIDKQHKLVLPSLSEYHSIAKLTHHGSEQAVVKLSSTSILSFLFLHDRVDFLNLYLASKTA